MSPPAHSLAGDRLRAQSKALLVTATVPKHMTSLTDIALVEPGLLQFILKHCAPYDLLYLYHVCKFFNEAIIAHGRWAFIAHGGKRIYVLELYTEDINYRVPQFIYQQPPYYPPLKHLPLHTLRTLHMKCDFRLWRFQTPMSFRPSDPAAYERHDVQVRMSMAQAEEAWHGQAVRLNGAFVRTALHVLPWGDSVEVRMDDAGFHPPCYRESTCARPGYKSPLDVCNSAQRLKFGWRRPYYNVTEAQLMQAPGYSADDYPFNTDPPIMHVRRRDGVVEAYHPHGQSRWRRRPLPNLGRSGRDALYMPWFMTFKGAMRFVRKQGYKPGRWAYQKLATLLPHWETD